MLKIVRTTSNDPDFRDLVVLLDGDLTLRYGELQKQYSKFNHIGFIDTVVVAYDNDEAAGCGCFRVFEPAVAEIKRMFVRPGFRGRGIARMILAELEKWAVERGFTKSVLETGIKQSEAIHLYYKFGYTDIPNYAHYEGNENSICMSKKLIDYD